MFETGEIKDEQKGKIYNIGKITQQVLNNTEKKIHKYE